MSLLEDLACRPDASADEEEIIRNTGAIAYAAGSDTVYNCFHYSRSLFNSDRCHRLYPP
jgi:hypothetical protein